MTNSESEQLRIATAATNVFWGQGYLKPTMPELAKAAGVMPGVLYHHYGSKDGLFEHCVRHYTLCLRESLEASLDYPKGPLPAICELFRGLAEGSGQQSIGSCFLVKSQLELSRLQKFRLLEIVQEQTRSIEAVFHKRLKPLFGEQAAKEYCTSLMIHLFGIRLFSCYNFPDEKLLESVQHSLPWLPWNEASLIH